MNQEAEVLDGSAYRRQVRIFSEIRPHYEQMACCLEAVLQEPARVHDLLLIVQSRAKGVASFAEKIQRKRYGDPLNEMSDLCGVRVIAHTLADVDIVCRYLEQHFDVLPDESDDKREGLKAVEFGYLSRHYEVRFKPGVFLEDIVPEDLVARRLKAEVQVRTILQHAWADIEYELAAHPDVDLIPYFRPQLERAARRCRAQADAGINMPWAHFDLGKFQMMLAEPYAALAAYALGVMNSSAGSSVDSALRSFVELQPARGHLAGFDWMKGFLESARRIRFPESDRPPDDTAGLPDAPVVVVAGYAGAVPTDEHRVLLAEGLADHRGTIVSGGTRAGVCELAGELQRRAATRCERSATCRVNCPAASKRTIATGNCVAARAPRFPRAKRWITGGTSRRLGFCQGRKSSPSVAAALPRPSASSRLRLAFRLVSSSMREDNQRSCWPRRAGPDTHRCCASSLRTAARCGSSWRLATVRPEEGDQADLPASCPAWGVLSIESAATGIAEQVCASGTTIHGHQGRIDMKTATASFAPLFASVATAEPLTAGPRWAASDNTPLKLAFIAALWSGWQASELYANDAGKPLALESAVPGNSFSPEQLHADDALRLRAANTPCP